MFTSFRQRLLFCFILTISVSFIIIALTHFHLIARNKILRSTTLVESTYILLLKDVIIMQNFFSQDTHNPAFFATGQSENISKHELIRDSMRVTMDNAIQSFNSLPYTLDDPLLQIERELIRYDVLFDTITALIVKRGYKDHSLEGTMRQHIHWLENTKAIPSEKILSLRRHEKDYIIRNEPEYVNKLNALVDALRQRYAANLAVRNHLTSYQKQFNEMVILDAKIGLKDNAGLKQQADERLAYLERSLNKVVREAQAKQEVLFAKLNSIYLLLALFLVLISIISSFVISRKITKPLTELTQFITRFIDSQFTVEEQTPKVRSKDEIGKLTANFTLLKNEVISHLKFFRQKVDERTAELQEANKKLIEINEANSRFVPKEFLQYLGKKSIEEVLPGDQIAREMTVLFTDIRSFTQISESLSPQDNFDFINAYLKEILPVIREHHGFIDKFIGDTVMAIFPDSPDDAIRASLGFTKALQNFNTQLQQKGDSPIAIGTGIHTGHLILGTIGNSHRLETTVISDAVNIAARIECLTKYYHADIIVSEETLEKVKQMHGLHYRYLDEVRVKGKLKSTRVYEILDPVKDAFKISYLNDYEMAIRSIKAKNAENARTILNNLMLKNPHDNILKILSQRCQKLIEHGFPNEWDGIEIMHTK